MKIRLPEHLVYYLYLKLLLFPNHRWKFGKADLPSLGQSASLNFRALGTYISKGT